MSYENPVSANVRKELEDKSAEEVESWRIYKKEELARSCAMSLEELEAFSVTFDGQTSVRPDNGEYVLSGNSGVRMRGAISGVSIDCGTRRAAEDGEVGIGSGSENSYFATVNNIAVSAPAAKALYYRFSIMVANRDTIDRVSFSASYDAAEAELLASVLGGDERAAQTAMQGGDITYLR